MVSGSQTRREDRSRKDLENLRTMVVKRLGNKESVSWKYGKVPGKNNLLLVKKNKQTKKRSIPGFVIMGMGG